MHLSCRQQSPGVLGRSTRTIDHLTQNIFGETHHEQMHFSEPMDDCDNPVVATAQTISECASLLPPLSPQPPVAVNVTCSQDPNDQSPTLPSSGSVTLLVPMNGPISPKPGEKVFIDNVPQLSNNGSTVFLLPKPGEAVGNKNTLSRNPVSCSPNDGIKLLIPVRGPTKHGETIFVRNAPDPGGPVFLIPSQTDPNEKVLVPATSQQGGNSGAIILVSQQKNKSLKQNCQSSNKLVPRKKQKANRPSTAKDGSTTVPQAAPCEVQNPVKNPKPQENSGKTENCIPSRKKESSKKKIGPGIATRNRKQIGNNVTSPSCASEKSIKVNSKQLTVTKTMCLPATQRQPIILGDRARQVYEKNVSELKSVIKAQKRKIQKQQRDLDRLRQEKKEGVKHLPKKHLCKLIRKHLPGYVGQFIEAQLINYGVEVKNKHRWEMSDKVFALAMWHRSPLAYKLLRETFAMPSVKTLQHWTATVPPDLDFYDVLKDLVKKKLPLGDDEDREDESDDKSTFERANGEITAGEVSDGHKDSDDSDTLVESDLNDGDNS